ncbi:MAG: hypothetical protein L3J65_08815 [Robiginitomaculum sp.]|nr:hypothetical protein [Robiginitomaculum sp.]
MLNILSRITGSNRAEKKDAKRIYAKTMAQSRLPEFYGDNLCEDTTDGRMEILCLHISTIMYVLRGHGDTGAKLTQAIYDVMIDDFDVALREEGLADTGVSRRIKPLAKMFFARAKQYANAFDGGDNDDSLEAIIAKHVCKNIEHSSDFTLYGKNFLENVSKQDLGDIASGNLSFPKFSK